MPSAITEAEARGFSQYKDAKRKQAKKAWECSARKRRPLALAKQPRRRSCQQDLELIYPVQHISRRELERRDRQWRAREGIQTSERGLETLWQRYRSHMATYRVKGQDFKTTNGQGAQALRARNRARCPRTVQRIDKRLADMGLIQRGHVRRGGSRVGQRDCLRIHLRSPFVTPPTAAAARPSGGAAATAAVGGFDNTGSAGRDDRSAEPTGVPPPRHLHAVAPPNSSDEEEEPDTDEPLSPWAARLLSLWGGEDQS